MVRNDLPVPYPVSSMLFPLTVPAGPQQGTGWRGAYLSAPIGPDPWGSAYMVNSAFLSTAADANSAGEGRNGTSWNRDTFCLSAGPNKLYETYFGGCLGRPSSAPAARAMTSRSSSRGARASDSSRGRWPNRRPE